MADTTTTDDGATTDTNGTPPPSTTDDSTTGQGDGTEPIRLPDDHPLVKAFADKKAKLADAQGRLKEIDDAGKDEITRITEDRDAHRERADTAEAELARLNAAVKHSLPEDLVDLLGTGTPDEIEKRAAQLAKRLVDTGRRPTPSLGQTQEPGQDPDAWLRAAARRS